MARHITQVRLLQKEGARRRNTDQRKLVSQYAKQVGEVIFAWNALHSSLFLLFSSLMKTEDPEIARVIWLSIRNDSTQRELVLEVARVRLPEKSVLLRHIRWIHDMARHVGEYRNLFAHTHMHINFDIDRDGFIEFSLIPEQHSSDPKKVEKLSAANASKAWRRIRGDLSALEGFTISIMLRLKNPDSGIPLPKRPRLLFVPREKQATYSARLRRARNANRSQSRS